MSTFGEKLLNGERGFKETRIMLTRRRLVLIGVVLIVAGAISCVTMRGGRGPDRLHFVGGARPPAPSSQRQGLVVVTHGWIEQSQGSWPEDMAAAISRHVDPNQWLCGYFDWPKGAQTINATAATEYARDIAGPRLAEEILKQGDHWRHIHMIGHSSGCWAISEAAKILARKTKADLHLTFLDAYVPMFWQEESLGNVETQANATYWADQYYTRDYTLGWTQHDLSSTHNVDVTDIDQHLKDHNFPWKWYHATITGKYPAGYRLDNLKLVTSAGGIEYGFARSLEAQGGKGWNKSLKLPAGNKAVKLRKNTR